MFPTGQQYWRPKMATSILRLGRLGSLKCFQSQSWIIWRNRSVASFCTQAEEPPKKPKKTKTTSKTATPDERASLLAYRTAVIFPVKVSETPSFPGHSVGVAAAAGSGAAASAEPRVDPQTAEFTSSSSKPADEAVEGSSSYSSSSSSSDSESDSDSDSDDELSQAKTHISEPTIKHESGDGNVTSKLKDGPEESRGEYDRGSAGETPTPEVCSDGTQQAARAESGAPAGAEEPGNSPESLEVAESPAGPAGPAVSAEDVSTTSPLAENSTDVPAGIKGSTSVGSPKTPAVEHGEAADGLGAEVPDSAGAEAADGAGSEAAEVLEGSSTPADADVKPTEAGESEASSSTESSELMEAAPVRAESEGEELQPEEAAAPVPPEPEEPLDISTYKNYQHHSYHPFTFADMDVEMAKYRLPQPTADRH